MPVELRQVLDAERRVQQARAECELRGAINVQRVDLDRFDAEIARQEQLLADRFGSPAIRWIWLPAILLFTARIVGGRAVALSGIPLFAVTLLVAVLGMVLGLTFGAVMGMPQQATILIGIFLSLATGISFATSLIAIDESSARQRCSAILKWKKELGFEKAKIHELKRKRIDLAELIKIQTSFESLVSSAASLRRDFESIANQLAMVNWRAMRGIEFENFLATVLRYHGFEVSTTKTTGDQGIDLIASSPSTRLAIQVKGYENSVGNDAVQQAHAGKTHYKCTHSIVITNSVFTRSARELAASVDCRLVDESQIPDLISGRLFRAI